MANTEKVPPEAMKRIAVLGMKISKLEDWKKRGFSSDEDLIKIRMLIEDEGLKASFDAFVGVGFMSVPVDNILARIKQQIKKYQEELEELNKK